MKIKSLPTLNFHNFQDENAEKWENEKVLIKPQLNSKAKGVSRSI